MATAIESEAKVVDGEPREWRTHALTTAISKVVDGLRAFGMVPPDLP